MYICNFCDYDTNDKSNINHHNKTKKHITNKKLYDKINNLEKKDLVIDKDTEKQIKLLNSENEKLKQELLKIKEEKEKEKQIIQQETKVEIYKELSEKGKNINNNNGIIINNANTNNLNYVNKHFKKAPPLKKYQILY